MHQLLLTSAAMQYAKTLEITARVKRLFPEIEIVNTSAEALTQYQGNKSTLFDQGKKILLLDVRKGQFLSRCPGTRQHICCNYHVLSPVEGCCYDCSYCFLQGYQTRQTITCYVNLENMYQELNVCFDNNPERLFRIGTGEFSDSLNLESLLGFNRGLVEYFRNKPNALLELKTKCADLGELLNVDPGGRVVISWSLNSALVASEEHGASTVSARIQAAKLAVSAGYRVGFHFDPVVDYANWESEYAQVVRNIFDNIPEAQIAWISLGALRFNDKVYKAGRNRFLDSFLFTGEFIRGKDKKYRYHRQARVKILRGVYKMIRQHSKKIFCYLCMESPEVWAEVFMESDLRLIKNNIELERLFNQECFVKPETQ